MCGVAAYVAAGLASIGMFWHVESWRGPAWQARLVKVGVFGQVEVWLVEAGKVLKGKATQGRFCSGEAGQDVAGRARLGRARSGGGAVRIGKAWQARKPERRTKWFLHGNTVTAG